MKFLEFLNFDEILRISYMFFFPDFPFNQWIDGRVGRHHPSKRGFEHVLNQGNIDISMSEIGELWKMVIRTWILKNGKSHHRCIWRSTKWMGSFVQLILTGGLVNRWNIIFGMEYESSLLSNSDDSVIYLCIIIIQLFFGTIFCQLCRDFAVDQVLRPVSMDQQFMSHWIAMRARNDHCWNSPSLGSSDFVEVEDLHTFCTLFFFWKIKELKTI